jgi:N-acetylglutamate synthase/N-acetylornithine aminotransferase
MSKARDLANAGTALGAVTATELGYVDGVTSAIQTQIDSKEATLPSQTGNSGKYLTTNGTAKSWGTISAGSMTLLSTTTLSGSVVEISSIDQTYNTLVVDGGNSTSAYVPDLPESDTISKSTLKSLVEASTDFANFKARIAAL